MRKEVVLAILFGFGIGLLIAFGIITARTALKRQSDSPETKPSTQFEGPDSPSKAAEEHRLTILTPNNNDVINQEQVTIAGSTTPGSTLAITTEEENFIIEADKLGQFSQSIKLISGVNLIRVVSFSPEAERKEAKLTVVYTTAEF